MKLKLSKTSWLILTAGIFFVIVASLGLTRSQQLREQGQLDEELGVAEMRIDNVQIKHLQQQQEELQKKLDESQIQLTAAKDKLRQPVESIDVTGEFYTVAYSCDVEVVSISSSSITSEQVEDITCSMININASVTGKILDLIRCVISLNTDFTTGIVKSAQMSIHDASSDNMSSASIVMVVYAYEGD